MMPVDLIRIRAYVFVYWDSILWSPSAIFYYAMCRLRYMNNFISHYVLCCATYHQRRLTPSGAGGGRLTPEGHEGWSTVWGLGGDKTLNTKNTIMTLLLLRYVTDTHAHTVM